MLHHKINRDHSFCKPLEGQKRTALMHAEYRQTGEKKSNLGFSLLIGNPYFLTHCFGEF